MSCSIRPHDPAVELHGPAPILPERETELRQLLESMTHGPGQADPNNALLPFAEFETLHFARFVILDDKTT